ncbi:hypothetical protein SUGI_1025620 [Cryptomeria japonica]|nr:hypothetical protein SUGI_1025620 [Cryptomeria japonica]
MTENRNEWEFKTETRLLKLGLIQGFPSSVFVLTRESLHPLEAHTHLIFACYVQCVGGEGNSLRAHQGAAYKKPLNFCI